MVLGMEVGLSPGDLVVLDGDSPPPQFFAHFYCGQTAGCTKMLLGMALGLSPGDCVRWRPSSSTKRGRSLPPQFSAHFYCGQTGGCIKMPLGMVVGLIPGDFVLDGDPVPSPERGEIFGPSLLWPNGWMDQDGTWDGGRPWSSPHCVRWGHSSTLQNRGQSLPLQIFGPSLLCPNGWMHQDPTWYGGRLRPRRHCVRWGHSSPSQKGGGASLPNFRPMSVVAKRLDGSRWHLAWRWALIQATLF